MTLPRRRLQVRLRVAGRRRHAATEPAYRIEAGDAVTRQYSHRRRRRAHDRRAKRRIQVSRPTRACWHSASSIRATSRRSKAREVTIDALANEDIESAYIDFDCDATLDQRMQVDGDRRKATFTAGAEARSAARREHHCYQLRLQERRGPAEPAAGAAPDRSHARSVAGDPIRRAQEGRDRSAAQRRASIWKSWPTIPTLPCG